MKKNMIALGFIFICFLSLSECVYSNKVDVQILNNVNYIVTNEDFSHDLKKSHKDEFIEKLKKHIELKTHEEFLKKYDTQKHVKFNLKRYGINPKIDVDDGLGNYPYETSSLKSQLEISSSWDLVEIDLNQDDKVDYVMIKVVYIGSANIEDNFIFKNEDGYFKYIYDYSLIYDYYCNYKGNIYGIEKYESDYCIYKYKDNKFRLKDSWKIQLENQNQF